MSIQVNSLAFAEGQKIPAKYTGDGQDLSPPLSWKNVPDGTKSFAVICEDPDAPAGTWTHWVLFNLPASQAKLEEGFPKESVLGDGSKQGKNDFGKIGYGGPAPPRGKPHRYFFKLYALGTELPTSAGANKKEILADMKGHVLAEGQLMGTYQR